MTKTESKRIKGIAIILMFWHHLFGCGEILVNNAMSQWTPILGKYDEVIGGGAKISIVIFCALSGYGVNRTFSNGKRSYLKHLWGFMISYWLILFGIAVPYLVLQNKIDIGGIWINLFALLHNDDLLWLSLSWYVKVYLEMMVASIVLSRAKLLDLDNFLVGLFAYIILPIMLIEHLPDAEFAWIGIGNNSLSSIRLLCTWYPVFYIGFIFSKYEIIEKVRQHMTNLRSRDLFFGWCIGVYMLYQSLLFYRVQKFAEYTGVFCVCFVFVVLASITSIHDQIDRKALAYFIGVERKILEFLGEYSLQLWLLSGMFFLNTQELSKIAYFPRVSVFIVLWNFILLLPIAVTMKKISKWIAKISIDLFDRTFAKNRG